MEATGMISTHTKEHFEQEALPHFRELYRTTTRLVASRNEAEDLVQEVFMHAWQSFPRYQPGTNCRAWLYKILFHRLDHYRRRYASRYVALDDDWAAQLAYDAPAPERLTDKQLIKALRDLPDSYREVVVLADVQECSYKEIAQRLNIPMGTVMSRLNRGRKLLRGVLADVARSYGFNCNAPQCGLAV
jgi:RNA polymerase sigma-70 factor (ECF subfamily)